MVQIKKTVLICLIITLSCFSLHQKLSYGQTYATSVPILTYHDIGYRNNPYTVKPSEFEAQMKYLVSQGYAFLGPGDIDLFLKGKKQYPQKSIMITFDDGCKGVWEYGLPILKKYKIRATLFVVFAFLEREHFITFSNLDDIVRSDLFFIGSHTFDLHHAYYYPELKKTIPSTLKQIGESDPAYRSRVLVDLQKSIIALGSLYPHLLINTFAYPYGACSNELEQIVQQAGFQYAFAYNSHHRTLLSRHSRPFLLERYPVLPGTAPKDLIIH